MALSGAAIVVTVSLIAVVVARRSGPPARGQIDRSSVVMLGDRITEQAEWESLLPGVPS